MLKYALALGAQAKGHTIVRIVRVVTPDNPELMDIGAGDDTPWLLGSGTPEAKASEEKASAISLESLRRLLNAAGGLPANTAVELLTPIVKGSVAESIVTALNDPHPPGICIVGSRGVGSFKRLIGGVLDRLLSVGVGSVSDALLRMASFPVCVIPAPPKSSEEATKPPETEAAKTAAVAAEPAPKAEKAGSEPKQVTPTAEAEVQVGRSLEELAINSAAL